MDLQKARNYFPYLTDGQIYFNHAATGPMSSRVVEILNKYIKDKSGQNIDDFKSFLKIMNDAKERVGRMINAEADRIAFTDNTSNGLNIIAQGLDWQKGDRIILNDVEFPANVYPFLNLKKEGVEIDFVKSNNGTVSAEAIIEKITPQTKLVSVSFVQFLSGYRIDLKKLGEACKENNVVLCVDAIQGLGAVRLNVKDYNIDFISCGTQKWLLGMQGLAFVYASKEIQNKINAKYIGWLSVKNAWDFLNYEIDFLDDAGRYQNGTVNSAGIYAFNESLKLFEEFGFGEIENRILENTKYFINLLSEIGIEPILKNYLDENLAGITSFKHSDADNILMLFEENKIICSVRNGLIRLSPHFYNNKEDIDRVISVLKENNIRNH